MKSKLLNQNDDINHFVDEIDKPLVKDKNPKPILMKKNVKKENKPFQTVLDSFHIDEYLTKLDSKQNEFNSFLNSVVPIKDFNYMSDLLQLPTTTEGYKYLLVVVDLATSLFDIEPLKDKQAKTTLMGYKNIIKRKILTLPEISFKTDNGTEFKGEFNKFLEKNKILHKFSLPYRHKQMAVVESLNKALSRILMNYLNKKSTELNVKYKNWTDILPQVRTELNKFRERNLEKLKEYQNQHYFNPTSEPKYKIGDFVHFKLEHPQDFSGNVLPDSKFRSGDRRFSIQTRKITDVLFYPDEPYYRYKIQDMPNVSYSEHELKPSKINQNTYIIKKIIGKKTEKGKVYYLVWWRKYLKKDSTWEAKDKLIEDDCLEFIKSYEKEQKGKRKKK